MLLGVSDFNANADLSMPTKLKTINYAVFAAFIFVNALLTIVAIAQAGENDSLSLGYGSLSPVARDAKTPSPNSLTIKYGFSLLKDIRPYVGTGVAYVLPADARLGDNPVRIKTGLAGVAGIKFDLGISSSLKIDYKYLRVNPDQSGVNNGTPPQSIGVGLEIKF